MSNFVEDKIYISRGTRNDLGSGTLLPWIALLRLIPLKGKSWYSPDAHVELSTFEFSLQISRFSLDARPTPFGHWERSDWLLNVIVYLFKSSYQGFFKK